MVPSWLFSILMFAYAQSHDIEYVRYANFIVCQLYVHKAVKIKESVLKLSFQKYFLITQS